MLGVKILWIERFEYESKEKDFKKKKLVLIMKLKLKGPCFDPELTFLPVEFLCMFSTSKIMIKNPNPKPKQARR